MESFHLNYFSIVPDLRVVEAKLCMLHTRAHARDATHCMPTKLTPPVTTAAKNRSAHDHDDDDVSCCVDPFPVIIPHWYIVASGPGRWRGKSAKECWLAVPQLHFLKLNLTSNAFLAR